ALPIYCAHGSCKLDGLACRGFEVEAILVVGRFVTDLPMPDSQRSRVSVSLPVGIPRIIAIRHPFGGFLRVGRAHAALDPHVLLAAVRLEVDADQRLRASSSRQIDEFAGAHLGRFDSASKL